MSHHAPSLDPHIQSTEAVTPPSELRCEPNSSQTTAPSPESARVTVNLYVLSARRPNTNRP